MTRAILRGGVGVGGRKQEPGSNGGRKSVGGGAGQGERQNIQGCGGCERYMWGKKFATLQVQYVAMAKHTDAEVGTYECSPEPGNTRYIKREIQIIPCYLNITT